MNILFGPDTGPAPSGLHWLLRIAIRLAAALPLFALAAAGARAAEQVLTLEAAASIAIDGEPGRVVFVERAEALGHSAAAAAELPDPELRVALANVPIESGGFTTEGMTQGQLGLRQRFPPGATLAYSGERLRRLADEQFFAADARVRDTRYAVRAAWLDAHYWERAAEIVAGTRPLFEDLVTVTRSLYSVGNKDQQDVLRAELELARLDARLLEIDGRVAQARAMLAEWIGADAKRPLPATLPTLSPPTPPAQWEAALELHPVLLAAGARRNATQSAVDRAEQAFKPGWALDLAYGYRDGRLPDGTPRSDFISLSVTVDLPFLGRTRRSGELSAALGERRAAEAAQEQLRRQLRSRLAAEYVSWQSLGQRIELHRETILPQAADRARAALLAYQSETGDFADVMRGRIDALDALLQLKRLETDRAISQAALARLGGIER